MPDWGEGSGPPHSVTSQRLEDQDDSGGIFPNAFQIPRILAKTKHLLKSVWSRGGILPLFQSQIIIQPDRAQLYGCRAGISTGILHVSTCRFRSSPLIPPAVLYKAASYSL